MKRGYRQHSKATLGRTAALLLEERYLVVAIEARKWRRRLAVAVLTSFAAGAAAATYAPALFSRLTAVEIRWLT